MPTIGWIREGDWDSFLEATEHVPSPQYGKRDIFRCPFCTSVLTTKKSLQDHIAHNHFVERPVMFLGGAEPGQTSVVRSIKGANEFVFTSATVARVKVDDGPESITSIEALSDLLARLRAAEVTLVLENTSETNATPVSTTYRLSFRIAAPQELRLVELAFSENVMAAELTRAAIDKFISDERCRGPGSDYAGGLANYSIGILQKERPDADRMTTPFSSYAASYGAALKVLSDFERPFSRLVSSIIRFAKNDFSKVGPTTSYWELDIANALLSQFTLPTELSPESARRKVCPIDHGTGLILDLAVRTCKQKRWSNILDDDCRQTANSDVLDVTDRQKALAIWALGAWKLGAKKNAIEPLRQISAIYPFRSWAEYYLETVTK